MIEPAPDLSWTWSPVAVLLVAGAGSAYWLRWRRVTRESARAMRWRLTAFAGAVLVLLVALVSPFGRLGEQLVGFHTLQHVLLTDVAPILIVLSLSASLLAPVLWALRRFIPHPAIAVVLYAGTIAVWHVPALYDAAVQRPALHALQHATLFGAGLLFWWHAIAPVPALRRVRGMAVAAYMVLAKLLAGGVASMLAFAPSALFPYYAQLPRYWGIDAIEDQQVGGALMMGEQAIAMTTAFCLMFVRMLGESDDGVGESGPAGDHDHEEERDRKHQHDEPHEPQRSLEHARRAARATPGGSGVDLVHDPAR